MPTASTNEVFLATGGLLMILYEHKTLSFSSLFKDVPTASTNEVFLAARGLLMILYEHKTLSFSSLF